MMCLCYQGAACGLLQHFALGHRLFRLNFYDFVLHFKGVEGYRLYLTGELLQSFSFKNVSNIKKKTKQKNPMLLSVPESERILKPIESHTFLLLGAVLISW